MESEIWTELQRNWIIWRSLVLMLSGFRRYTSHRMMTMDMTLVIIRRLWQSSEQWKTTTGCLQERTNLVSRSWWIWLSIIHPMNMRGLWRAARVWIILIVISISGVRAKRTEASRITGDRSSAVLHGSMIRRPICISCICFPRSSRILIGTIRRYVMRYLTWWTGGAKKALTASVWMWSVWFQSLRDFRMARQEKMDMVTVAVQMVRTCMNICRKWTVRCCQSMTWSRSVRQRALP